jgi:hypothetical protein
MSNKLQKLEHRISDLRKAAIIANLSIYFVLILLVILFNTIPSSSKQAVEVCGVQSYTFKSIEDTPRWQISIAYPTL